MDIKLSKFYFKEYAGLKTIVYELGKPILYDDKLNLCHQFKHEYKLYDSYTPEIKEKVNIMLSFIKEVIASNSIPQYEYILKWFANIAHGNKNDSIFYMKGSQGIGKSTITQFLMQYVIGHKLSLETGAESLISKFNIELGGKLLVCFEELEHLSINEWNTMSTKLKRFSTSHMIMLEAKNEKRFEAQNINNYMINSNHDCVKDDDGRRYFINDVSCHRKGDLKYFANIRDNCFNNEVGEAFFSYLKEIDVSKFYSQNFPMTQSKKDSYVKRLHSVDQYLKDTYVLTKTELHDSVQNCHLNYKEYCSENDIKNVCQKIDFNKKMTELGFSYYSGKLKGKTVNRYKISTDEFIKLADSLHWIHDLDEYIMPVTKDIISYNIDDEYKEAYDKSQLKLKEAENEIVI
jgi:hypothetical protein